MIERAGDHGEAERVELVAVPCTVPAALMVTEPSPLPVTTSVATPPTVELGVAKLTEPVPVVWEKVRASVESTPDKVTVLPAVPSMVAVKVRVVPEARLAVKPVSAIWVAVPDERVTLVEVLVDVQDCHLAVTV